MVGKRRQETSMNGSESNRPKQSCNRLCYGGELVCFWNRCSIYSYMKMIYSRAFRHLAFENPADIVLLFSVENMLTNYWRRKVD